MRNAAVVSIVFLLGLPLAATGADPKPAEAGELAGWGEPLPADLAVLEELEGENLAEAKKQGPVKIAATRKDLNGDGIPELFFRIDNPMFCWEEEGCAVIVVSRASLTDRWREIGAVIAPSTSVLVLREGGTEFPSLKAVGARTYVWDGQIYKPTGPAPPVALELEEDDE